VTGNTVYVSAAIEKLRAEDRTLNGGAIACLSPARYEDMNPYRKYLFEVDEGSSRTRLRPVCRPAEQQSR
jgi:hypothetical protein